MAKSRKGGGVYVKAHTRAGHLVKAYTRGGTTNLSGDKKKLSVKKSHISKSGKFIMPKNKSTGEALFRVREAKDYLKSIGFDKNLDDLKETVSALAKHLYMNNPKHISVLSSFVKTL